MQDDHNRYGEEGSFIGQYRDNKELPNFRPRVAEPYRPAQPQPRPRVAPTEETYGGPPVAEPRSGYAPRGGYASRGGVAPPRQAPPRQPRSAATESSDDYRPQYSSRAGKYDSDTRYRPAPEEAEEENHDTVV
ncbi:hypothetical protein EB796_006115 [Bugula neritina]|uniref:Uncharacterized protein n=1 Tax=Bugula neritina TaxID=10212 RepID=A0A7J7KD90_BUGNE|nr:hypothetical protein EB796_006115 [Bugula neritina]